MADISPLKKRYISVGFFLVISLVLLGIPVYQAYFQNPIESLFYLGEVEEFTMPSTTGENYTFSAGSHTVTVVSFIYTKCPGTEGCALLTVNMAELEDRIEEEGNKNIIEFISIDFDYINDTLLDLRNYRNQYTQDFEFWQFLLGNENQTKSVAAQFNFYFEVNNFTDEGLALFHGGEDNKDPYVHSMVTYVIDRSGNIRKLIIGTEWNFKEINNVIDFLLSEDWETAS